MVLTSATTETGQDSAQDVEMENLINRMVASDFLFSLVAKLAPGQNLATFGVPANVREKLGASDKALNRNILDSMLPQNARFQGIVMDQLQALPAGQEIRTTVARLMHSRPPNGDS